MTVTKHLDNWLGETSLRIQGQIERMHFMEMARLDYIYAQVAPFAFPKLDTETGRMIPPDDRMINLLLKVIKSKLEWRKQIMDASRKDKDGGVINIDHMEVTISQSNPLYSVANQNMNEEQWAKYADMSVADLYTGEEEIVIEATPSYGIPEQIDEVGKFVDNIEKLMDKNEPDDE